MSRGRVVAAVIVALLIAIGVWIGGRRGPGQGEGAVVTSQEVPGVGASWRLESSQTRAPCVIEGLVKDSAGRPVGGALVALSRESAATDMPFEGRRPVAQTTSRADGRFRFSDVRPGKYLATAVAEVGGPARSRAFTLASGGTQQLTLVLSPAGHTVDGQVIDSGGGSIAGATVTAVSSDFWQSPNGPWPLFHARADDRGHYRLVLLPGEVRLRAEAPGYSPTERAIAVTRAVTQDLKLHPAARVSGRVIERATGRPVGDAEVRLSALSIRSFISPKQTRADGEGTFAFDDAEAGTFQVTARRGPLVGTSALITIVEADAVTDLEVATDPAATVQGRAVDEQDRGVAGARVMLFSNGGWALGGQSVVSAGDGSFRAEGVLPGSYSLRGEAPEMAAMTVGDSVTVGQADVRDVKVVLIRGGVAEGKVVSADGKPVAGARIEVTQKGARSYVRPVASADDGTFRLGGLGTGPASLYARSAEAGVGRTEVGPLAPGQTATVTLRLAPTSSLSGLVKLSDGRPAAGVAVAVTGQGPGLAYGSATTDTEGRFAVKSLPPGRYTVWARRKGGPQNISTSTERPDLKIVEISAALPRNEVELTLGSGGKTIAGTVVLADGKPASGTLISANKEEGDRSWKPDGFMATDVATARPDGSFLLEDLDDGVFRLWASRPGFPDTEVKSVTAGRRDVRIELRSPASASGVVTTADGKPVKMFTLTVVAVPAAGDSSTAARLRVMEGARPPVSLQDPNGTFVADGLDAGTYDLKAMSFEGGVGQQRLTLATGEKKQGLRLVIQPAAKVTGKVVALEGGAPISGARVGGRLAGRSVDATTKADGSFELANLAAGDQLNLDVRVITSEDVVPEYRQVTVPATGSVLDVGVIRLMQVEGKWFERSRDGVGLGFMAKADGSRPSIDRVRPGTAAEKAGLKSGDVILNVEGRDVSGLGPGAVQYLLTGKPGTSVTLTVQSPGAEARQLTVTRLPPSPPPGAKSP